MAGFEGIGLTSSSTSGRGTASAGEWMSIARSQASAGVTPGRASSVKTEWQRTTVTDQRGAIIGDRQRRKPLATASASRATRPSSFHPRWR